MHRSKLALAASCLIPLFSPLARGQEKTLTLSQAIDLALRQNHAIKIAHYNVAAAEQKRRGARSDYFPTLSNDSNAIYITNVERIEVPPGAFGEVPGGPLIPNSKVFLTQGQNAYQSSGTMLAQPITQLIKIHQANKIAEADLGISQAALQKTSTDVVYTVHQLYYQLLITRLERNSAELQITSSSENLSESREQYKDGSLLQAALVASRATALEARQTLLTADMQISDLTVQLNDVLGLPLDTKLVLDPNVNTAMDLPSRQDAADTALKQNPEVQQAQKKLEAAQAAEAAAKAQYIPDITGFARYSYQNGVAFVDHNFGTFGVHLTYDLFDGGRRSALIRQRRDEVSEAKEDLARIKEEIGVRIATIYNKLETTRAMVGVAKESLAAREESARLSDLEFKQGELLISQRDATHAQAMQAQAGLLQASLNYLLAKDELTRTLGRLTP